MRLMPSVVILSTVLTMPLYAKEGAVETHTADRVQIQQLVHRFQDAIHTKNGDALRSMFLSTGTWGDALSKNSLVKARAQKSDVQQLTTGDFEKFAKVIETAPKPIEEIFDDVHIETDGTIGMVYFNYQFLMDGKPVNHGAETWQLVHIGDEWKISAILYSDIF